VRYLIALACCLLATPVFSDEEPPREELFLSTPEQVSALTSEPSYLIGGLISPLSGQPVLKQTDLIIKGAQSIVLHRTYVPPYVPSSFPQHKHDPEEHNKRHLYHHLRNNYKGWQFYPHLKLELNPRSMQMRLSEPTGMTLDYRLSGPGFSETSLVSPPHAISNAAGEVPSGKYDPRNTRISYEENGNRVSVHATDGTIRIYLKKGWIANSCLYLLAKEILPNGKVLKYHYNEGGQLHSIESLDPKERYVYSSLRIAGTPWDGRCQFTSSSGLTVDYNYQKRSIEWKIKEKIDGMEQKERHKVVCPPILTSVSSPSYRHESLDYCERFLLSSYSGKEEIFNILHSGFGKEINHYRVHRLLLPVGQNDAFLPIHKFFYVPPVAGQKEGRTAVTNSDGTLIAYHFSKDLLITSIQYFGQNEVLKKEKLFSWDDNHWLKALEMRDGHKNTLYRKSFEYDRFGNPILELFTGDLTGKGTQETFTTKRTFSEDGRNLLLREETEEGKVLCLSYLPHTDLVTSKLTKEGDKIILREFSLYDDCHNLIQTISDDGSSEDKNDLSNVTQRTLTTYTLRQLAPFLHMPEWIEETYWEAGTEKPLKKSHLIYDQHGNVAQEEVYDAQGNHAYTICKTYNERGDVLSETNRLGQEATYRYDPRGRPEATFNFSQRIHTTFRHDAKGRLKAEIEKGDDGIVHETSSEYDFHDRRIQRKDFFQNTTHYVYDPLVSEVIKTDFPSIASIDGQATSVSTLSTYDPFGRELTKTDANGNTTTYRYNAYGSPVEMHYPDGSKEYFRYTNKGTLASHTDPDGVTIHFTYDVLGRALSKTYISENGEQLATETFTYNGFNPLTETDKEGNVKKLSYDGAGRKIREEFCGQATDFSYDSLGRLTTTCKHNGSNTLFIHYKRDLEDRILEERKRDSSNRLLYQINYSYDKDGNRETVTRYINGKEATSAFAYDSCHRQIEYRDAKGSVTRTEYNEGFLNHLGQKVLQRAVTDPRQITRIETQDALTRTIRKELLNPQKLVVSCQELTHDPHGNLVYQRDHLYENELFKGTQTIRYTHTPDHRVASITRAFGTKEARTTTYTYSPSGKIATKTLPDGVTLTYTYHPLGFMNRLDSSDGKIHHIFAHNKLGHLKYALDANSTIAIQREIDPFGNVLQELFSSGFRVKKEYDQFNRLLSLKMDREGEVFYTYDPLFLREVTRTSRSGATLYSHTYQDYDLDGNLIVENLIGNLGQVVHATDPKGLEVDISSPYFSQQCDYDSIGNLISTTVDGTAHHYSYDHLSQLSSENGFPQSCSYAHDSLYNRTQRNGKTSTINDLNELLSVENVTCSYDLNGNQLLKKTPSETLYFTYDPLNRLTEASSEEKKVNFVYDPLGRRLSKVVSTRTAYGWKETTHEDYLYHGQNEIGAFASSDQPKNLRVLGLGKNTPTTVGIELEGQVFAPVIDVQGNLCRLIDLGSKTLADRYEFTAFGEKRNKEEHTLNPWRFACKRFDPELGLIYFGKRYYDPEFARWITTDPAGFVDGANLYQYVFNNPFLYKDQDGQFAFLIPLLFWGAEAALPALSAYAGYAIAGVITGAVAYGGYKAIQTLNERRDSYSAADDYAEYSMQSEASCEVEEKKKHNTNPFDGPVDGEVVVVDEAGNAIKVPEGNWLTGSKDGKWVQEMKPGVGPKGEPTGQRKDGGGHPPPKHTDVRANEPHAHVPGITNPDGTDWLPLKR